MKSPTSILSSDATQKGCVQEQAGKAAAQHSVKKDNTAAGQEHKSVDTVAVKQCGNTVDRITTTQNCSQEGTGNRGSNGVAAQQPWDPKGYTQWQHRKIVATATAYIIGAPAAQKQAQQGKSTQRPLSHAAHKTPIHPSHPNP
jgi:hypothetical protein